MASTSSVPPNSFKLSVIIWEDKKDIKKLDGFFVTNLIGVLNLSVGATFYQSSSVVLLRVAALAIISK